MCSRFGASYETSKPCGVSTGNSRFRRATTSRRHKVPVIIRNEGRNEAKMMKWGLVPFAFSGLWDCWIDRDTGKPLYTFTIITTHAHSLLRRIHDRMPVMHRRDIGHQWLEYAVGSELELLLTTQPVLSEELEAYEVSTLVKSPENDSPEYVRRVSAGKKT